MCVESEQHGNKRSNVKIVTCPFRIMLTWDNCVESEQHGNKRSNVKIVTCPFRIMLTWDSMS